MDLGEVRCGGGRPSVGVPACQRASGPATTILPWVSWVPWVPALPTLLAAAATTTTASPSSEEPDVGSRRAAVDTRYPDQ